MAIENAAPEVRNLKQMLQYQEKAVVSRMLLKNPAGNVTLFAFDGDEGLSEHTAPYDALVIAVEGRAEIPIGGVRHTLNEGDVYKRQVTQTGNVTSRVTAWKSA